MPLSATTVLSLAPDVALRFRTASEVYVERGATRVAVGIHGLSILEAFRAPTPYAAALDRLEKSATGMQDLIAIMATVNELVRHGVLVDATAERVALGTDPEMFDSARVHVDMLNDRVRTDAYLAAIQEVVRPGDVVLDIGTGTGVFAVAAARAGAAHVYAIEATGIASAAREVFEANGVADRVTLLEGLSPEVTLPTRATVLVAELIGLDPLAERILETTRDAVDRLLTPGARLIPSSIDVFAVPVTLPDAVRGGWSFSAPNVEQWRRWYGIDFAPLLARSAQSLVGLFASPRRVAEWTTLAEPTLVVSQDLAAIRDTSFEREYLLRTTTAGRIDAVVMYFSIRLSPSVALTTDPRQPRDDNHWDHRVWLLPQPLEVERGEPLHLTVRQRTAQAPLELRRVPSSGAPT